MKKAKRRLKKVDISFVSLCPRGANQMPVIYKEDGSFEINSLVKAADDFDEKGELLTVVYVPEKVDSQGDIASKEVVKECAYTHMRNGADIDIRHDTKALSKDDVFVAESFIIQKGDERFNGIKDLNGEDVDVTGAWGMVLKINNEDLRKQYREGNWNGVSMYGKAQTEEVQKEDDETLVTRVLKALGLEDLMSKAKKVDINPKQEEIQMDKEELVEVLAESQRSLVSELVKALKPSESKVVKEDDKGEDGYTGDPTDKAAIAKHLQGLKAKKAAAEVDWNDSESVEKYLETLEDEKEVKKDSKERAESNKGSIQKMDMDDKRLSKEDEDAEVERLCKEYSLGYED